MCCLCFVYTCIHRFPLLHKAPKGKGCLGILRCCPAVSTDFWPLCHQAPWAKSERSPSCGCVGQPPASTTASARQSRCLAFWSLYLQYGIHMACNNTSEISQEEPRKRFCQMTGDDGVWMHDFSIGAAMQSYLSKCLLFLASRAPAGCPMAYLLRQPIHLAYRKENGCVFCILCVFFFSSFVECNCIYWLFAKCWIHRNARLVTEML